MYTQSVFCPIMGTQNITWLPNIYWAPLYECGVVQSIPRPGQHRRSHQVPWGQDTRKMYTSQKGNLWLTSMCQDFTFLQTWVSRLLMLISNIPAQKDRRIPCSHRHWAKDRRETVAVADVVQSSLKHLFFRPLPLLFSTMVPTVRLSVILVMPFACQKNW